MGIDYAWEKLSESVSSMAISRESLHDRLLSTLQTCTAVTKDDFPPELGQRWQKLQDDLSKIPSVGSEGAYEATLNQMPESEVKSALKEIVSIFYDVAKGYYKH